MNWIELEKKLTIEEIKDMNKAIVVMCKCGILPVAGSSCSRGGFVPYCEDCTQYWRIKESFLINLNISLSSKKEDEIRKR